MQKELQQPSTIHELQDHFFLYKLYFDGNMQFDASCGGSEINESIRKD